MKLSISMVKWLTHVMYSPAWVQKLLWAVITYLFCKISASLNVCITCLPTQQGERLSHAVGCAFAACLERKQKRDKECGVTMSFDPATSAFTRSGSFRQMTVTERLSDPQEWKPIGKIKSGVWKLSFFIFLSGSRSH